MTDRYVPEDPRFRAARLDSEHRRTIASIAKSTERFAQHNAELARIQSQPEWQPVLRGRRLP
jgi:hypothetical protein